MKRKHVYKAIIAIAVAMAFVMPVAAFASNEGPTNNPEIIPEIYSAGLCPLLCYDAEYIDITLGPLEALGDTFYAYNAYPAPEGPVSFQSDNPGSITLLKETTSSDFMAGGTWAEDTWYGCQFNNGWLWTIDEVTGDMTLIGGGGVGLNGLAYDLTTGLMYGATGTDLYSINMISGDQTLVGSFNTGGLVVGIAFDGEGNLYAEDLGTDCLYSVDPLTGAATLIGPFGLSLNYAQDMAYDITWDVLYLAAYTGTGQLYTCDVTTGACTLVGDFQGGAEITGFAMPYIITHPPEIPEQPSGPTEGLVGVEYTFSTRTTDPEGEQVYYKWDWGDGTVSEWFGPFDSGDTVLESHTWMEAEMYEVTVKAKDIYNRESDWSEPKIIHILGAPVLEIGNISGGLFKVTAEIKNMGGVGATGVDWSITLDGGFILMGKETSGKIASIPGGGKVIIESGVILGIGEIVITVTAEIPESSDTKEQDAFVFLVFITV